MKIVMMATGSEETLGGETRVALEISLAMSKVAEVAIILTGKSNTIVQEGHLTKVYVTGYSDETMDGESLPNFTQGTTSHIFDFLDDFQPDIIHSHSLIGTPILGQIWAKMNGIPYFHTVHMLPSKMASWLELEEDGLMYAFLYKGFLKSFFESFMNNCDGVVALNENASNELKKGKFKTDLYIIPNGRFLEHYSGLKNANIEDNEKKLIFIGSYSRRKNQVFLIKMMKFLPSNYKLITVGRAIVEGYRKIIDREINGRSNIDAKGPIEHTEIPKLLESAHLFVSASKVEVQALAVLEALASATPVVGLSNDTIDELITDENGKWLKKNSSPKQFAKAVERILSKNREEYDELCKNSRSSVKDFDWDRVVERTIKMYSQYIKGNVKVDQIKGKGRAEEILDSFPEFPGKKSLSKRVVEWEESSKKRVKKIVSLNKVSKRVLLFTGVTVGAFATMYGISRLKKAAKDVKKKVSK